MNVRGTRVLAVGLLLIGGSAGCTENPEPVADNSQTRLAGPNEAQDAVLASPKRLSGKVTIHEDGRGLRLQTREYSLGKLPPDVPVKVSPDDRHVAYIRRERSGKYVVVVDGKGGSEYDAVGLSDVQFSPDSERIVHKQKRMIVVNGVEGPAYDSIDDLLFSPDGKRFVYTARRGRTRVIAIDGVEQKGYLSHKMPTFSPNGKHLVYGATRGEGKWVVVVDGAESNNGPYDSVTDFVFSPDGKRLAYIAERGRRQFVVVDDIEGKKYSKVTAPTFSPDGRRVAYAAWHNLKWAVVIDGKEGPQYRGIATRPWRRDAVLFSPDSKRFAYIAYKHSQQPKAYEPACIAVVDGTEGPVYDLVPWHDFHFSRDGKRLAYLAHCGEGKYLLVVDGVPYDGGPVRGYGAPWSIFSPDSQHFAFVVKRDKRTVVVVDGKESDAPKGRHSFFGFSPDSRRIAYQGRTGVVVENVATGERTAFDHPKYAGTFGVTFSPDSKHIAYVACRGDRKKRKPRWMITVDGLHGKQYDRFLTNSAFVAGVVFDSDTELHSLAVRDDEVFLVEMEILSEEDSGRADDDTASSLPPGGRSGRGCGLLHSKGGRNR